MGISGLLPMLSPVKRDIHIKEYANKRVAIDGYCWLHKAVYSCSQDLCLGIPTTRYITYCLNLIQMMKSHKIIPILVFDGGPLPNKKVTEDERRLKRAQYKERGNAFLKEGNSVEANRCYQKAVDVTPQMAFNLIKELRRSKVEYVVAPYEADAQLAFLACTHQVDAILTEDSDLIAYGTPIVLFKMNKEGYCEEIRNENIVRCKSSGYDLSDFDHTMLRQMCILSGCDYLPSIHGMGIKTAYKLFKSYRQIEKVFKHLKGNKGITEEYIGSFYRADLTFRHQRVYDPVSKSLVHFSPLDEENVGTNMDYLGEFMDNSLCEQIATGIVDPVSKVVFDSSLPPPVNSFIPQSKNQRNNNNNNGDSNNNNGSTSGFTFKTNRITQYLDIITKPTNNNNNNNNRPKNMNDPFTLDDDQDEEVKDSEDEYEFEFDFTDESNHGGLKDTLITPTSTKSKYFVSPTSSNGASLESSSFGNNDWADDGDDFEEDDQQQQHHQQQHQQYVNTTSTSFTSMTSTSMTSTSTSTTKSTLLNSTNNGFGTNGKKFKKNSLVSEEERLSMEVLDQFTYNGGSKRKQSFLMMSTSNNNNNNYNQSVNNTSFQTNNNNNYNNNNSSYSQPIKFNLNNNNNSNNNNNTEDTLNDFYYSQANKRKDHFDFNSPNNQSFKRNKLDTPPPTPETPFLSSKHTTLGTTTQQHQSTQNNQPQPQQQQQQQKLNFNSLVDQLFEDDDNGGNRHDPDSHTILETPPQSPRQINYIHTNNNEEYNNNNEEYNNNYNNNSDQSIGNLFNSVNSSTNTSINNNSMNSSFNNSNNTSNPNISTYNSNNTSSFNNVFKSILIPKSSPTTTTITDQYKSTPTDNNNNNINNSFYNNTYDSIPIASTYNIHNTQKATITKLSSQMFLSPISPIISTQQQQHNNNNINRFNQSPDSPTLSPPSLSSTSSFDDKKYGSTSDTIVSKYFTNSNLSSTPTWKERLSQKFRESRNSPTSTSPT